MSIDAAAPGLPFGAIWSELPEVLPPGSVVGKFYGRAFTIKAITEAKVTIDSPDVGGLVDIPRHDFEAVYAKWHKYRYENLSHKNSQNILHAISIINHIVQTWVRREERVKQIESARKHGIPNGVFWIVNYNKHSRIIGPSPSGEPVLLSEVFPDQPISLLSQLELIASNLHGSASMLSNIVYSGNARP